MKLDKELARTILLAIEEDNGDPRSWVQLEIADQEPVKVAYHIQLLSEAGFVEADNLSTMSGYDWRARRLTFEGHEYLDTVRDGKVWAKTKEISARAGAASLTALFDIAKAVLKQQLIEHGIHIH